MLINSKVLVNFYKYKRKIYLFERIIGCRQTRPHHKVATHTTNDVGETRLKVLFFGSDQFSLPSLKALHKNSNSIASLGTVTSFKSPSNCVRIYAEQEELPIFRWPITVEMSQNYDVGVVVSFGHLIPEYIIKGFPLGMINVHASLLPRWRGAAPIIYSLMNNDATTGVTIMKIEPKHFDIGDILAQQEVRITKGSFMPELHTILANEGAKLLLKVFNNLPAFLKNAKKQNNDEATYAPKITPALTEVVWPKLNAEQVYDRFRALFTFKNLNTKFLDKNVQLIEIKLPDTSTTIDRELLEKAEPGTFIYQRDKKCLCVICADRTYVEVYKLRMEGRKIMNAVEFNNGFIKKHKTDTMLFSINKNIVC